MANQIASLPTKERVRFYQKKAEEAARLAQTATTSDAKASYERLISCWSRLAEDVLEDVERFDERRLQNALN